MSLPTQLRGDIRYFLLALIILHFTYPFSEINTIASTIYVTIYSTMMGIGLYLAATTRKRVIIGTLITAMTIVSGIVWALTSNDRELNVQLFIFYVIIIADLCYIAYVIGEFIFSSDHINSSVLAAGVSLYLVIGNIFTPLYFLLNAIVKVTDGNDAFVMSTRDVEITWQRMYYFSFTTLTTLGYGDISPVAAAVEPFVLAESIIGVLYIAVLMARLVSLYDEESLEHMIDREQ